MTFTEYWQKLNEKKKIDGDVKLTPSQFEKMMKQVYDIGYSAGAEKTKEIAEMVNQYKNNKNANSGMNKDNAYEDLFGNSGDGDVADFLKGMFSGKKK